MHPELFSLPGGFTIKTYGFCLMIGFLSAVWLAMRRAARVKADPDRVLDISFFCLLFGVGGARAFYVIHYWTPQFSDASNRFLAVIDITGGGLEFVGGFIGATVAVVLYGVLKKFSLRLYLDIMAPGAMWGLAFGRLGCFFNGCCFGGVCEMPPTHEARYAWAVHFPFASPAHWKEWEDRQVTVPAELITTSKDRLYPPPWLLPDSLLAMSVEKREGLVRQLSDLRTAWERAKAQSADSAELAKRKAAIEVAENKAKAHQQELASLITAQRFPSRVEPSRRTSVSELEQLASQYKSLAIHPTQLYAAIHAMLLSAFLSALFYVRKRHGVVIATLLVLYPIQRVVEEMIRVDNPHDVAGLTVSQFVGLVLFLAGVAFLITLYKALPERSPYAVAAQPADAHR
jgi:phosphatidylglycerol:prolipoprotein diacylglycerol transferase